MGDKIAKKRESGKSFGKTANPFAPNSYRKHGFEVLLLFNNYLAGMLPLFLSVSLIQIMGTAKSAGIEWSGKKENKGACGVCAEFQ